MALGPGTYDPEAQAIHFGTGANATVLCVYGGRKGSGYSLCLNPGTPKQLAEALQYVAKEMRTMAANIEKDAAALTKRAKVAD